MTDSKPVIVIVPGGFHRPRHYDSIIVPLRERGHVVLTPALVVAGDQDVEANSTAASDVTEIHKHLLPLLDQGHEAIMVAHSYGSVPATESIGGHTVQERVARGLKGGIVGFVCVAGFAYPQRGRNIMGGDEEMPPMPYQTLKDGLLSLTEDAKPLFYSDLSPEAADAAFSSLCKFQSHKSLNSLPQVIASEILVPKTYLLCEKDQTVAPAFQEAMIQVGKFDTVVRLKTGHCPFLSSPNDVVAAIVDAADP